MNNIVNNVGTNSTQNPADTRANKSGGASNIAASSASGQVKASEDTVEISNQAIDLSDLEARIRDLPDVDKSRVEQLRAQINNNSYQIDNEAIASKMLNFEFSL